MKSVFLSAVCSVEVLLATIPASGQPGKVHFPVTSNLVRLYDSLFMDQTEVTNRSYMDFVRSVQSDSAENYYLKMLPDEEAPNYVHGYFQSPALADYPVVAISHAQAKAYCTWRSRVATSQAEAESRPEKAGKTTYQFRLPTEEEWFYAAAAKLDTAVYFYGYKNYFIRSTLLNDPRYYYDRMEARDTVRFPEFEYIFRRHLKFGSEPFFNCVKMFLTYFEYGARQPLSTIDQSNKKGVFREKYEYFHDSKANDLGISGMIGNVSEMTLSKGVAKGGSWAHMLGDCKISKRQHYEGPTGWLGFRCICIVRELK